MAWKPRQLTAKQREERRTEAARLLRAGWTQAEVARELSVSPAAVCSWAKVLTERGEEGLKARRNPGRASYLSPLQWTEVCALLEAGAAACGFPTERWTLHRVAQLIRQRYGVRYHPHYLTEPLHRLGFSPQAPPTQAKERDDALVEAWLRHDWPRIKRGLVVEGQPLPSWTRRVVRFGPA
jgi:putative transposase